MENKVKRRKGRRLQSDYFRINLLKKIILKREENLRKNFESEAMLNVIGDLFEDQKEENQNINEENPKAIEENQNNQHESDDDEIENTKPTPDPPRRLKRKLPTIVSPMAKKIKMCLKF